MECLGENTNIHGTDYSVSLLMKSLFCSDALLIIYMEQKCHIHSFLELLTVNFQFYSF